MNILTTIEKDTVIGKYMELDLPDEVLKKVYYKNALNLFPFIKRKSFF